MSADMRSQGMCSTSSRAPHCGRQLPAAGHRFRPGAENARAGASPAQGSTAPARARHQRQRHVCRAAQPEPQYPELEKMVRKAEEDGVDEPMKVVFRDVDTFNLWLWFELYKPSNANDKDLLETLLESWFVVGRMGGFNSANMQIAEHADSVSFFKYDVEQTETAAQATFMDYSNVETRGSWCRFWVNMGTADEMSLDILINMLAVFSRENLGVKQLLIGGMNEEWPVPSREDQIVSGLPQQPAGS